MLEWTSETYQAHLHEKVPEVRVAIDAAGMVLSSVSEAHLKLPICASLSSKSVRL